MQELFCTVLVCRCCCWRCAAQVSNLFNHRLRATTEWRATDNKTNIVWGPLIHMCTRTSEREMMMKIWARG
uniref:Putative secreted protein n=1 Tax=Anopheles darlingi TaxID=43151 RepID=A0A2M4DKP2_ANODA